MEEIKVVRTPLADWKRGIVFLAVLYEIQERKRQIAFPLSGEDLLLKPAIDDMFNRGLLIDSHVTNTYTVSPEGEAIRKGMVGMYDQLLKFEIFGAVNQALSLTADQSPDGAGGMNVFDDILDPRFSSTQQSEDLRLAMLDWYGTAAAEQLGGKTVDLYQVVFMQRLRAGKYNGPNFWADLRTGKVFADIEAVVDSAVKWTQMGGTDDESSAAMNAIYAVGMTEQIKRDGDRCTCGAYLGMYDFLAKKDGHTLDACGSCNKPFGPPPPAAAQGTATEECPNCGYEILPRHRKCHGCGAKIDRHMAAGSVREVTTSTTYEDVTYDYGYDPYFDPWAGTYLSYGYYAPAPVYPGVFYDPFDPVASVLAFGLVCSIF